MHAKMHFSYLRMAINRIFKSSIGIDLFGNHIFGEMAPSMLDSATFAIKPLNPLFFPSTYFFRSDISTTGYFCTNLASFSLRMANEKLENYLDFIFNITAPVKYSAIINYLEGGQFWGECKEGRPLDGKMYSNVDDFNTISFEDTFKGRLSLVSKSFKYEGFFQENLPHYHGSYYLNNVRVYNGELRKGKLAMTRCP